MSPGKKRITLETLPYAILAAFGILSGLSLFGIQCGAILGNHIVLLLTLISSAIVVYKEVLV